jgi:hypothetical protein
VTSFEVCLLARAHKGLHNSLECSTSRPDVPELSQAAEAENGDKGKTHKAEENTSPMDQGRIRELKVHSKSQTAVAKISRAMKRTASALRQQALKLGMPLGHLR